MKPRGFDTWKDILAWATLFLAVVVGAALFLAIFFGIAGLVAYAILWSINTLFGYAVPYTWQTLLATWLLFAFACRIVHVTRREKS